MKPIVKPRISVSLLIALSNLCAGSTATAAGPAPEGRTYFVFIMGVNDDPYEAVPSCLAIGATQACFLDDQTCLSWQRTEGGLQTNKEIGFSLAA